jgi:hypothetical protein
MLASVAAEADIGLIASDIKNPNGSVGLPNRCFDYLTAKLPVIGPAMPDVKGLIDEYGFGRIVDPVSPENWRDAILAVAAEMASYKEKAQRAKKKLTWETQEESFYEFISRPRTVTMISHRDSTRYQRFIRMALTLNKFGCKVKMLTVAENPRTDSLVPGVEYYCIDRLNSPDVVPLQFKPSQKTCGD